MCVCVVNSAQYRIVSEDRVHDDCWWRSGAGITRVCAHTHTHTHRYIESVGPKEWVQIKPHLHAAAAAAATAILLVLLLLPPLDLQSSLRPDLMKE